VTDAMPAGWISVPLRHVVHFNPKHHSEISRDTAISFVPMAAVSDETGVIELRQERRLADVWTGYTHFAEGDVIFAKITPCMENGKAAIARGLINGLACGSTEFHVFRPGRGVIAEYLWHFVRQRIFRDDAAQVMTGAVGQRRVPLEYLKACEIPLPSLAEQRRIVARIEALFARTRRARADLERAAALIGKAKLATLQAAFMGDLTSNEPASRDGMEDDLRRPWNIPLTWSWRSVREVGHVALGRQRSPVNHSGPAMRPYLRAANVTWSGLDLSDVKEMNFQEPDFSRFRLVPGDVLLSEGSGSAREVGKPAIWRGEIENCCFQNTLVRVQPKECTSDFLYFYFLFSALSGRFVSATQGVNIYHIGKEGLADFAIPVPSKAEQDVVTLRLRVALERIERSALDTTRALVLLDRLEQSILTRAFRGELVEQDPNDEPAEALLSRSHGATTPTGHRGRSRSTAAA